MIHVTRLQGEGIVLNADQILYIERTPDTMVILANGQRLMIQETPEVVVERVVAYRRAISSPSVRTPADVGESAETEPSALPDRRWEPDGKTTAQKAGGEA